MNFSGLRDFISESTTETVGSFLTPEEIKEFTPVFGDISLIASRLSQLQVKYEKTLNASDLDDTTASRDRTLQIPKFMDNRGEAGNELIAREYGYENFVERYYKPGDTVSELVQILLSQDYYRDPLILTAGRDRLQNSKIDALGINNTSKSVVESQSLKPRELLRYIMEDLGYIPGKIIIYEDRPECFHLTGAFLAKLLGCEIVVNHVTLSGSNFNKIKNIKQKIYDRYEKY